MYRSLRKLAGVLLAVFCILGPNASLSYGDSAPDFSAPGQAFNVLPPGQYGNFPPFPSYATDQLTLYDGLTPLFDQVTDADLPTYFKKNTFGLSGTLKRTETVPGHPDLVIERDVNEVAHIDAPTRSDVMFGIGYVTAEDRTLLMDLLRNPGRIAAVDAPGLDAFTLATSFQPFTPSQQTEDFLAQQEQVLLDAGPEGQQIITDIDDYLDGINTYRSAAGVSGRPWNRNDVIAVASMIGAVFGKGGGDEARRSELLSALQNRLGTNKGLQVWNDLREQNDPEAPVSVDGKFRQRHSTPNLKGNEILDAGSLDTSGAHNAAVSQASRAAASNAILVGKSRSATGHPFFVAGPQVGYFYPGVLYEVDAHGGGIDARGATFPGSGPYVELGRGQDYSWSATSSGSDIIDIFVETLCGDDRHYRFEGECREMTTFDAGTVGFTNDPVVFRETVHGPVIGYATVDGKRVALSSARTTRGRDVASALGFADLNTNAVHDVNSFYDAANKIEFTFNWFYADNDNIAMFSSGRLPVRHPQVDMGLPTNGTGKYEWRGFMSEDQHPHGTEPSDGVITNWNNKPAFGWQAADNNWSYGSLHREQMLRDAIQRRQTHTLGSVVAAMNRAATQDFRDAKVLRGISAVLDGTTAPSPRDQQMLNLLEAWRTAGSSRLDRDNDGKIDDPGAAIMDKAWPKIADAVMSPVLGPQLGDLASLTARDNPANRQGSAYNSGWYGYVDKDLRTVAGGSVAGRFRTAFCGADVSSSNDSARLAACRDSLWAAIDAAGNELASAQGTSDPASWRAAAGPERIQFLPGFLPYTMRWTNRPTFQQVISYDGHR
jgi:acyl-homoserine lactone acylase PvdQ